MAAGLPFVDTNDDRWLTPQDALVVVTQLNLESPGVGQLAGKGESGIATPLVLPQWSAASPLREPPAGPGPPAAGSRLSNDPEPVGDGLASSWPTVTDPETVWQEPEELWDASPDLEPCLDLLATQGHVGDRLSLIGRFA